MLTRRRHVGDVRPALAVEHLRLRHQLAVRLAPDHHDLAAHDRRGRRGTRVIQRRQLLPRVPAQDVHAVRLPRRQLLARDEAADHHRLALVGHRRRVVQRAPAGPARSTSARAGVVDLRRGARRLDADPADHHQLAAHRRRRRVLTPERRAGDRLPREVRKQLRGDRSSSGRAASLRCRPSPPPASRTAGHRRRANSTRPAPASSRRDLGALPAGRGRRAGRRDRRGRRALRLGARDRRRTRGGSATKTSCGRSTGRRRLRASPAGRPAPRSAERWPDRPRRRARRPWRSGHPDPWPSRATTTSSKAWTRSGPLQARGRRRVLHMGPELGHVVVLRVRDAPREHLVQDAPERVEVGTAIHPARLDLLRSNVVRGSDPGAGAGEALRRSELLRQSEVSEIDLLAGALSGDQDVGRLDVAVHEPALVRRVERRCDRTHHSLNPVEVQLAPVDDVAQVGARHEAHRQVEDALELAAAVDRDDVGMLERRREPSLGLETGHRVRVLGVLGRDDLQRHGALEVDVGGLVDNPHPAAVEDALDPVAGEQRAGLQAREALGDVIHGAPFPARRRPRRSPCAPLEQRPARESSGSASPRGRTSHRDAPGL